MIKGTRHGAHVDARILVYGENLLQPTNIRDTDEISQVNDAREKCMLTLVFSDNV